MKLINKRTDCQNYLEFHDLLVRTPFTCDRVERRVPGAPWEPHIDGASGKFLFVKDEGLISTDGTTMQSEDLTNQFNVRFLNVQYVEVLEVVYVGVDG